MAGRLCRLDPLDPEKHAAQLHAANSVDVDGAMWTYLPYGPFATPEQFHEWATQNTRGQDPLFFAIIDLSEGQATGLASYLRIDPAGGSIEVGHVVYSPLLQRTAAATEAMVLMMRRAFDLGYRRYEWKCDSLNAKSRAAAERLGFTFEGVFRQATVYKGRSRDTAWFSILDSEWPRLEKAFEQWLDPGNFSCDGRQRRSLGQLLQRGSPFEPTQTLARTLA
jgi:RimJ/RimL family protein N-acetyltransferase